MLQVLCSHARGIQASNCRQGLIELPPGPFLLHAGKDFVSGGEKIAAVIKVVDDLFTDLLKLSIQALEAKLLAQEVFQAWRLALGVLQHFQPVIRVPRTRFARSGIVKEGRMMILEGINFREEVFGRELRLWRAGSGRRKFRLPRLSDLQRWILDELFFDPLLQLRDRQEQDVHGEDHLRSKDLLLLESLSEFELHFPSRKKFL